MEQSPANPKVFLGINLWCLALKSQTLSYNILHYVSHLLKHNLLQSKKPMMKQVKKRSHQVKSINFF